MAVILEIQNYRVGNYIDYRGGLGEFNFSKIEDIGDQKGSNHEFHLTHSKLDEFVGYDHPTNEIRPIILKPSHLKKLGFSSNDNDSFFKLNDIGITYKDYTDGQVFVFASMKIYKSAYQWPATEDTITVEQLRQNTVDINFVHFFQNYCSDRGWNIDFSTLENMR